MARPAAPSPRCAAPAAMTTNTPDRRDCKTPLLEQKGTVMIDGHQLANRYGAAVAVEGLRFTAQPSRVTGFLGAEWRREVHHDAGHPRPACPLGRTGHYRRAALCAVAPRCTRWVRCWMLAPRTAAAPSATRAGHRRQQRDRRPPRRRGARPGRPGQRRPQAGARVLPGLKQRPLPAGPVGSSCASGTRNLSRALATSVGRGSLAWGLWMRYHAVGAATLAPPSGLHGLITLQNWWSGSGSNRRRM